MRSALIGFLHEMDEVLAEEMSECPHRRVKEPEAFGEERKCLDCNESLSDTGEKSRMFSTKKGD